MQPQPNPKLPHHNKYTVAVRIRPPLSNTSQQIFSVHQNKIKQIRPKSIVTYSFDEAYEPQHTNQYIFQNGVKRKIQYFVRNGVNTTVLAYGQTGSGKTHTLFGHQGKGQQLKEKGLCQYILQYVLQQLPPQKHHLTCSFLQIYNQKPTDLLTNTPLTLLQHNNTLTLPNLTKTPVSSLPQLLSTLHQANTNKIFGQSYIHSESSRSHTMFCLEVRGGACLNVVDLCGCQVLTDRFDGKQRVETNSINLSLFTLNTVIADLCGKAKDKYIGFRNSVLTRLLKKSLIDDKKTQIYLFCNISPQQKHRAFSSSTLKFGQTAISIDQPQLPPQPAQNLSQQKRNQKKVQNIIDLSPKPNNHQQKRLKWNISQTTIWNQRVILYAREKEGNCRGNLLFLHAYGYGCCGHDWDYFLPYVEGGLRGVNLYSVDLPGFGESTGSKFTSRAEEFGNKGQPMEFMIELFKILKISPKNKVFLIGYDLGGAIALSSALHPTLKKSISGITAFHPTWTDKLQKLALITVPVQLIWFPIQNFHLVSAGVKMSKAIKQSRLYRLNVGSYTQEKAAGYYDLYSDTVGGLIREFVDEVVEVGEEVGEVGGREQRRGRIQEEVINIGSNKQEEELEIQMKATRQFYELIKNKNYRTVFDSIIKGGEDKPKYVRLASQLLTIEPGIKIEKLIKAGYFQNAPINPLNEQLPLLPAGRQVQVETTINLSVLNGQQQYLTYTKNGQKGITHRCYISLNQTEQQILSQQQIEVQILCSDKKYQKIKVDLYRTIQLNSQTLFRFVNGNLILQDNVTCKYSSLVTKLMLARCCYAIRDLVGKIDLGDNSRKTLELQKMCAKLIYQQMDLRHLVHQGIDNSRFTGIDVGRLAYYGQGNCHHLASVLAALLLPFSRMLGWEVIFRAGSFFMTGRDIDQDGNPLPGWIGKPNQKVQDHTWLQIVYKPSYQVFVMDPSFAICSQPIDKIYTFKGKMHISGKNQCGSSQPVYSEKIYDSKVIAFSD